MKTKSLRSALSVSTAALMLALSACGDDKITQADPPGQGDNPGGSEMPGGGELPGGDDNPGVDDPALPAPSGDVQLLATGQFISPNAIPGAVSQLMNPQLAIKPDFVVSGAIKAELSPDGNTLAVLTAGYNTVYAGAENNTLDRETSTQYIFIYDVSGENKGSPKFVQAINQTNAFNGLVWGGDQKLYASGGVDDNVYVYERNSIVPTAHWTQSAVIALGHNNLGIGSGVRPNAGGLGLSADGGTLVVANNYNDSITIINTANNTVVSEYDLRPFNTQRDEGAPGGAYPWAVKMKADGTTFVSSVRDREVVVLNLSNPAAPQFLARIPVEGNAYDMALSPDESQLYVAVSNTDEIAIINTNNLRLKKTIHVAAGMNDETEFNTKKYSGRDTISVSVAPDGRTLFAVNNGDNSISVISLDAAKGEKVTGMIPTLFAPKAVTFSSDGKSMYIVNGKSVTGANPGRAFGHQGEYGFALHKSSLMSAPIPGGDTLAELTRQVNMNNHYSVALTDEDKQKIRFLRNNIKHVIYIVKENRTFDQVFGDLENGANSDPSLTMYGKGITPNAHTLVSNFVTLDNFYTPGDGSMDGWAWVQHGHVTVTEEISQQENYAGVNRGMSYESEGSNRGVPVGLPTTAQRDEVTGGSFSTRTATLPGGTANALPGTANIVIPDAPYAKEGSSIYDAVLAAGLTVRNYGLGNNTGAIGSITDPLIEPFAARVVQLRSPVASLYARTDNYFRGYDQSYPDSFRMQEWAREFQQFVNNGDLPSFQLVRMGADHTGNYAQNVGQMNTAEREVADNDYAVGRLIDLVSKSPYAKDTLIIAIEDDSQAGSDHVDSHRSPIIIAGPFVKKQAVISTAYTQVDVLRTIEDILGTQHMNLNTAAATPMLEVFDVTADSAWNHDAVASTVLKQTNVGALIERLGSPYAEGPDVVSRRSPEWWASQTKDLDFSAEDRIPAEIFNEIQWRGVMGDDKPFPASRTVFPKAAEDDDD
ncbi:MAG: sulfatase-like hydrolase/transferase [Nevskiaceae bacterium]|jgi:DNA-binding beta-propeller fold protein YncE|nr:sulfatase-like hydrolase/transferase [Nevskiaceae bacterium]